MAVFTAVSPQDLESWLARYTLGKIVDFQGIASGIENSNFFLTTTRGAYVLTIFERLASNALPFYLELMRYLAAHRIPVPAPVPRDDGSLWGLLHGKPAAIVTRLSGMPRLSPDASHCVEVGQTLARLHLAGRDFPGWQPNPRSLSWWREVTPAIASNLTATQRALLQSELAYQEDFFDSPDYAALPGGPCHCDLFRDNVLFTELAGGDRLSGFFDFYFAGCDKWLFDIAVCINDWCVHPLNGALDAARVQAFVRAYQTVRPFTAQESEHWCDMLRAAALRFWVSRLYDLHLPRPAELLQAHDPEYFERVLRQRVAVPAAPWLS